MAKVNLKKRHNARRLLVQALYQWQLTGEDVEVISQQFQEDSKFKHADSEYFLELLHDIAIHQAMIDGYFTSILDRKFEELNPVELSVLRLGTYELMKRLDIPYKVVINEATELAKIFGAAEGFKYINAVLDKVARELRKEEISKTTN